MSSEGRRGQRSGSPAPSQPREALKWTPRMDEAYGAVVEKLGGLEVCKPKAVLQQLQADYPNLFADLDIQRVKWKLLSHRRREQRHRAMAPQGIAPPTKWSGRLEEAYEEAVAQLGGIHAAQPKQVLERLQPEFPDLTLEVIKWHLQGQRRRERRLAGRSSSTQPTSKQDQQQQGQEVEDGEEEERQQQQGKPDRRKPKQQQTQQQRRPARGRRRAASATPEAEGTAMSAAGGSDNEEEAAHKLQAQQAREARHFQQAHSQPGTSMQLLPQVLQPPLPGPWAAEQQLQQGMAQQQGQAPAVPAPFLLQPQLMQLPPLPGAVHPPEALVLGPSAPSGFAAGAPPAAPPQLRTLGGAEWAQHTLLAACRELTKACRSRLIVAQVIQALEEQRSKLEQLVPTLVAAHTAQAPSSSSGGDGGGGGDPLSQLLQSAQLLPVGQPWSSLASGSATFPPVAAPDVSPVPLKRQPRSVLAAAAAFPLRSSSPAVGTLQSGIGGGGSWSSGETGEDHLLTCVIPNCRRCAYERRLQGAKEQQQQQQQQQQQAATAGDQQRGQQQQQQQQGQQQQLEEERDSLLLLPQHPALHPAERLSGGIASEPLLGIGDPALVQLLGSLLGSLPPAQAGNEGPTL